MSHGILEPKAVGEDFILFLDLCPLCNIAIIDEATIVYEYSSWGYLEVIPLISLLCVCVCVNKEIFSNTEVLTMCICVSGYRVGCSALKGSRGRDKGFQV